MSTPPPKPARLLLEYGRPFILERFRRDSCIASTAIGIKVLRRFGVDAQPLPLRMNVFNGTYLEMMESLGEREPTEDEQRYWLERGAWSIESQPHPPRSDNGSVIPGHIAIGTKKHILDLAIDQANRPQKNIILEPFALPMHEGFMEGDGKISYGSLNGCLVIYQLMPDMTGYVDSPDWYMDERHTEIVHKIETTIRRKIRLSKGPG